MKTKIYIPSDDLHHSLMNDPNLSWERIAAHYPPSAGIDDWQKLHRPDVWCKGYSAFETADSWEKASPDLPPKIAALFYGSVELLAAIPEHKTPLLGGNRPSQTDVFAFVRIKDRVCAVAVEGKRNEPFGEPVGEWLSDASAGKEERLKYISDMLGLNHPPANEIYYQLLHHTASAVIEACNFNTDCAAMIVQSFSPEHVRFGNFQAFLGLFGIDSVKRDKLYQTDKPGIPLYLAWASPQR